MAFYHEGRLYDFNFANFWLGNEQQFACSAAGDEVTWSVDAWNNEARIEIRFSCPKAQMLRVTYENPDGQKHFRDLWNGGAAHGTVRLYERQGDQLTLIDEFHGASGGGEYGEYPVDGARERAARHARSAVMARGDDRVMRLPDGRTMGYAEYGDPDGVPVLSFHGGLSSRIDCASAADICSRLGIRLISPDRPGMGRSDFQPGRTLRDWPQDILDLADHLEIDRFAVMGWSAGGPYAAVCGQAIPARVTAGALLASAVPFEGIGAWRGLDRADQILLVLSRWAPWGATLLLLVSVKWMPAALLQKEMAKTLAPADIAALKRAGPPEAAIAFAKEALRGGARGVIQDYRIFGAPWGFRLEDVRVPMHVWQGTDDSLAPPAYPRLLANRLPGATLTLVPGEGHISLLRNHAEAILGDLAVRHTEVLAASARR